MSGPRESSDDLTGLSDDERHVARLLASLAPRESRINRDRTMFLAGRASADAEAANSRGRWLWPALTACSAAAGLVAGILLSASNRGSATIAAQSGEGPLVLQQPIGLQSESRDRETLAADSPSPLDLRIGLLSRAGDEYLLTRLDSLPRIGPREVGGARTRHPTAPLTYGACLGLLPKDEPHL